MPCTAAICAREHPHMVSVTVKRRPHEAVMTVELCDVQSGALCRLTASDGSQFICNIEYNQLETVLRTVDPRGDAADESGFSPCGLLARDTKVSREHEYPRVRPFPVRGRAGGVKGTRAGVREPQVQSRSVMRMTRSPDRRRSTCSRRDWSR